MNENQMAAGMDPAAVPGGSAGAVPGRQAGPVAGGTVASGLAASGTVPGAAAARRPGMTVLHWSLAAFLLLGAVQIFLAGLGAFRTETVGADTAFAAHRSFGFALAGAALVILVLALVARAGRVAVAGAAVMVVLTGFAQSLLAGLADHHALYGGLHAFDGLAILGVAAWLWARTRPRAPRLPR
jgi:Family of unknown function (DUF6220)